METRQRFTFAFLAMYCFALLGVGYTLQYAVGLLPCPLCITQRFFYLLIGLTAWSVVLGWPKGIGVRIYIWSTAGFTLLGGLVALRQVWLQHTALISDTTRCHVPLGSFLDSLIVSLGGVGNCVVRDWTLLGLSIAEWSLLCFLFIGGLVIWLLRSQNNQPE